MMDTENFRLECLKLAQAHLSSRSSEDIVAHARVYVEFVLDRHNPEVPGHELSGYVSPPTT